jgi:hypothetical protein
LLYPYMMLTILAVFKQACVKLDEKPLLLKHSLLSSSHSMVIKLCMCSSASAGAQLGFSSKYKSLYDPSSPSCASSCHNNNYSINNDNIYIVHVFITR